jgi:predicted RNase H-like HicB family nuclease
MPEIKDVRYYLALPFTRDVELREESSGNIYFLATVREVPFVKMHGATREEALYKLQETFEDCLAYLIERGEEIPEPTRWPGDVPEMLGTAQLQLIQEVGRPRPEPALLPANVLVFPQNEPLEPWTVVSSRELQTAGA